VLNIVCNVALISGVGPLPALGTRGAALGTVIASIAVSAYGLWLIYRGSLVVQFPASGWEWPDAATLRELLRFGLPAGVQGVVMNIAGVMILRFIGSLQQSAEAQAAYAVGYTELFSFITWTSVGLMGATATLAGQNLGAGKPERVSAATAVAARIGLGIAAVLGGLFLLVPRYLLALFGMTDDQVVALGVQLLRYLTVSGFFITVALAYTGGCRERATRAARSSSHWCPRSAVPIGICWWNPVVGGLWPAAIWSAIVAGHVTRCALSVWRFRSGHWQRIAIDLAPPAQAG